MINLTQHAPTFEQIEAGVVDLPGDRRYALLGLLTVHDDELRASPALYRQAIESRARSIFCLLTAELAEGARKVAREVLSAEGDIVAWNAAKASPLSVMVGGQPDLERALVALLQAHKVSCYHALSVRESVEVEKEGRLVKTSVFQHVSFSLIE